MKVILYHPEETFRKALVQWLSASAGHAVLFDAPTAGEWLYALAEFEPDLVLLPPQLPVSGEFSAQPTDSMEQARWLFPDCTFLNLPVSAARADLDESTRTGIQALLADADEIQRNRPRLARGYTAESRVVVLATAYQDFAGARKLHRPKRDPGWQERCQREEARFVLQLQTALADNRHERAKQYLRITRRFDRGLQLEAAYRLAHGSWKIAWLRDQIARWLTVMAHYIDGAEIDHCIGPQAASPRIAFLHHTLPPHHFYPIACVLRYGINPAIENQILQAAPWMFTGETENDLVATGCRLTGLCAFLAQAARAQAAVMDQFLAANSTFHTVPEFSRALHRSLGLYFEFWGWDFLRELGPRLRQITNGYHAGVTRVVTPGPVAPKYREIAEAMTHAAE